AYIVAAWALAQGIAQVFPVFDIPNWIIRLIVVLIVIGFPIALISAWAFEITPEGIKRTEEADAMPQSARPSNRTWYYIVIVGAAISLSLFFLGRYTAGNRITSADTKSIAVLPLGSLRPDKNDARTDTHIWTETYDRTAADLFAIQRELAQSIVTQLKAKLSPQQKAEIEERPTQDLDAFELYLQAKTIVDSYLNATDVRAAMLQALKSLDDAIKRDPNFVSAYCYAARANDLLFFFDLDPTPDRISLAEAAVNTALRLRPDSAEAHFARADYYFRCLRDYDRAQEELAIARPGLPNSTPFFIL